MSLGTVEQRTEGMKKQAQELIEQAYQRGFKAGADNERKNRKILTNESIIELIEQGRNEAWETAYKLASMEYWKCNEILGDGVLTIETNEEIFTRCTASEAIERIKAYEEQKKQEEDNEIRVGDVVRNDDVEAVATWCDGKNWNGFLLKGEGVGEVGQVYSCMSCNEWKKTGRTFPEVAEVLKKL